MQHLQPIISTLLVAIVTFLVEGFPSGDGWRREAYGDRRELGLPPATYSELVEEQRVLSAVTRDSLWRTLNFNGNVNIVDSLAAVLVGLSRHPPNGEIKYYLAVAFFSELSAFAPTFIKDVQIVGYIIEIEKFMLAKDMAVDYDFLFRHSIAFYDGYYKSKQRINEFLSMKNWIHQTIQGDLGAAKCIVNRLSGPYNKEFKKLEDIRRGNVVDRVFEEVQWHVNIGLIPFIADAEKRIPVSN